MIVHKRYGDPMHISLPRGPGLLRGPVSHPEIESYVDGPRIVSCDVKAAGLDPLGQVTSGLLKIHGCLKPVRKGHLVRPGNSLPLPRALIRLPKPYTLDDVMNIERRLSDQ